MKEYSQHKEVKAHRKQYHKKYYSKPEIIIRTKEYQRQHNQKQEVKKQKNQYARQRYKTPEVKTKICKYQKEYSKRLEVKNQRKQYYKQPERIEALKRYRQNPINKIKSKEYQRQHNQKQEVKKQKNQYIKNKKLTNKQFAICMRLRSLFNQALKIYTTSGKIRTSKQYGINYKAIIKALSPIPKDLSNWRIHHIIPLHLFDLTDLKQIKIAFAPENHLLIKIEEHKEVHNGFIQYPKKEEMMCYQNLSNGGRII